MEILGKHRPKKKKKKKWITDDILEMCDERRELKNKKHDAQGVSQYKEEKKKQNKESHEASEGKLD